MLPCINFKVYSDHTSSTKEPYYIRFSTLTFPDPVFPYGIALEYRFNEYILAEKFAEELQTWYNRNTSTFKGDFENDE